MHIKNFMVNAGKAWDDAYFSDTNDVRAQRFRVLVNSAANDSRIFI